MADSEKGASTTNSKKKGSSVDETFGEDFLNSWKSSKMGNDDINFDMETVPKNKKKSFDFGKLDDFELSGGFDKISSFKIDMPDLDFSSPVKKTENLKAKSSKELIPGKQESSQEKFSFNFDFNELDRFDLDSSPQKSERNPKKLTDDTPDRSSKPNMNKNSTSNSVTSSDLLKDQETKNQGTDSMGAARPDSSIGPSISKGSKPSTSLDLEHHDVSYEVQTSTVQQIAVAKEKNEICSSIEQYNEQSRETCLKKPCAEEPTKDLSPQPQYGDSSAQEDNSQTRAGTGCLDAVKPHSAREHDDGMRLVDSSQSRNTSPANSFNSRSCAKELVTNSSNTSGDSQKHHQGNEFEITGGKAVPSELNPGHKNIENAPLSELSKITSEMKNAGKKETSGLKLLPSSLQRSISMMEKPIGAEQFKTVNKLAENASPTSSAFAQKQLDDVHNSKMKKINTCLGNENGELKQSYEQAKNQKLGILKSYENGSAKSLTIFSGSERNGKSRDTSSFQLKSSSLPCNTASNTARSIIPNFLSSIASTKSPKVFPVEMIGTYKDDKACDISRLSISRITKLNSKSENSETPRGSKLARFSEKASKLPMSAASNTANPIVKEKCPLLSTSLKRKSSEFQESPPNPKTINPLKRAMGSAIGRKQFEISSNFQRAVVTKALLTEIAEICHRDNSPRHLNSNHVPEFGSRTDTEVPKGDKACDLSRLTISSQSPSCGTPREAKAESLTGQKIVSPSNRVMESATRSKPFDISPRIERAMVLFTENPEGCQSENRAQNLISNGAPELGSLVEAEFPVLIEKDENIEKAEAWVKELNDMSETLKKQHEEAKELLVRTLVTNNQLLMLNHPMLEEKINSLQRFANSLRSREF